MDKTPQLEAFGEELLNRIESAIQENGVFMFGIGDFNLCNDPNCQKDHSKEETFTDVDSSYIYSVGHQKRDRPDLLILTGPAPGEEAMTGREMVAETMAASKLINYLVDQWNKKPVLEGETCRGPSERVYQVVELVKRGKAHPMREFVSSATVYYQGMDFEFLVLAPLPHTLIRGPQNLH